MPREINRADHQRVCALLRDGRYIGQVSGATGISESSIRAIAARYGIQYKRRQAWSRSGPKKAVAAAQIPKDEACAYWTGHLRNARW